MIQKMELEIEEINKDGGINREGKEQNREGKQEESRKGRESSSEKGNSRELTPEENTDESLSNEETPDEITTENNDRDSNDRDNNKESLVKIVELDENNIETYRASLVDYGNACWTKEHFAVSISSIYLHLSITIYYYHIHYYQ